MSENVGRKSVQARLMARCAGSAGCSRGSMVSSRYSLMALDSNSDTLSSTRSTGTFLCGDMARNQSGRLSRSICRNSNSMSFSRRTIAARCTHGQVLKLTRRYFAMMSSLFVYRARKSSGRHLVLGFEIELDLHVVGVAEENLPAGAVGHLVHPVRHALARQVLLGGLEAAATEGDMIDHAGIGPLLLVGRRDIVDVQHGMI